MKGEVFVGAAEAGNEVVFKRADGAFGSVAAMDVGRDKLEVDIFGAEEVFKDAGAFVVEALEDGSKAGFDKERMGAFVGGQDRGGSFVLHGLGMDVVAVVVVEDEEFIVARARGSDKTAGLVGENLARVGHAGGEAEMGTSARGGAEGESIVVESGGA
jgi:hypothetical protein